MGNGGEGDDILAGNQGQNLLSGGVRHGAVGEEYQS